MVKNIVGSIWGTFVVPVPWLVAGGWGDGWCRCHGWWLVAGAMAGAVRCGWLSLVAGAGVWGGIPEVVLRCCVDGRGHVD